MNNSADEIQYVDEVPGIQFLDIEADAASPHGTPCSRCGNPIESDEKFCAACGNGRRLDEPESFSDATAPEEDDKVIECRNCGAAIATQPDLRSYVCPFCDSTYVVEVTRQSGRLPPEFVIGFAVTPEQARAMFRKWITSNSWFRPGDLKTAHVADKQRGVYLPFWSFSMLASSEWSANIGEYWYRTETYRTRDANGKMVTKTRRVRETEWWPLQGRHHRYYSGYLVSGSKGLEQSHADRIKPFNLPALRRYEAHYLAGWECEEYSIDRDAALSLCHQVFYSRERSNVTSFLPGDTHSQLDVQTHFSGINSDLCLLPIYILSYRYRERLYRFIINGQTGKMVGEKPVSWKRIWGCVGIVVGVIAAAVLTALYLQS